MNKRMNIEFVGRFFLLVCMLACLYACDDPVIPDDGSGNLVGDIFSDSFESKDFSKTNAEGFKWLNPNRTSIVTQDATDGAVAVNNGKPIYNVVGFSRDWTAKDGNYSMRFRYPKDLFMAEQRFDLGTPHRDLWISFWLRVPTNFYHRTTSESASGATNKKLLAIYMDGYSGAGDGPTVIGGSWSDGNGGSLFNMGLSIAGKHTQKSDMVPFITYPDDQGRWMHIVYHFKTATNTTSKDGIAQMWRRWDGGSSYQQLANITDGDLGSPPDGPDGWKAGYLMGWTNPAYPANTEWLLDDFNVSSQSLLD